MQGLKAISHINTTELSCEVIAEVKPIAVIVYQQDSINETL